MRINLKTLALGAFAAALPLLLPLPAMAADASTISSGDTAWMLASCALVLVMTPGLALFYGGMVRKKNVLSILMQCFFIMALISVQWILLGYTLSFGPDIKGIIGGLSFLGMSGVPVGDAAPLATTIPHTVFIMFQAMFAIITAGLITGAFAERMKFSVFVIFTLLWTTLVYDPLAHWVWGGGFLAQFGALDFAGGTVVHISSGVSGLVVALVLGKRLNKDREAMVPHNLPMTVTGAALLWFGWFGFNAGSALASNGLAGMAFLVTNTAAAAATLSWVFAEWLDHGKPTIFGAVSGAVAGLVAITPASGFVTPLAAIVIGLLVGPICYMAVSRIKEKLGYDDALDAFGIHGVGGTVGALATGLFATVAINAAGKDGLFYGNPHQLYVQFVAVLISWIFAGTMTFVILKVIGLFTPLRVSNEEEEMGLDAALHGEDAYGYGDMGLEGQGITG
ncbi:MAG TPA: ammonium transporter [Syntrophomonadaceae bacterium]|nr:ammonium transporter [Syntrophomonadaceae bacterium]